MRLGPGEGRQQQLLPRGEGQRGARRFGDWPSGEGGGKVACHAPLLAAWAFARAAVACDRGPRSQTRSEGPPECRVCH